MDRSSSFLYRSAVAVVVWSRWLISTWKIAWLKLLCWEKTSVSSPSQLATNFSAAVAVAITGAVFKPQQSQGHRQSSTKIGFLAAVVKPFAIAKTSVAHIIISRTRKVTQPSKIRRANKICSHTKIFLFAVKHCESVNLYNCVLRSALNSSCSAHRLSIVCKG